MAGPLMRLPAVVAWIRKVVEKVIAVVLNFGQKQIFVARVKNMLTNI
jgi:hypothetical protein